MILRDGYSTSYEAQHFRQMEWKNRKTDWYEAVSSALNFSFLKEVSQNCFVFDVVNFEKLRRSRRIVSFLMLPSSKSEEVSQKCLVFDVSSSKIEEVSQNCCVFQLAVRQTDRQTDRQTNRCIDR